MEFWNDRKLTWYANYLRSFPADSFQAYSIAQWMHEKSDDIPVELPPLLDETFGEKAQKQEPDKPDFDHRPGESDDEWFARVNKSMDANAEDRIREEKNNKSSAKDKSVFTSMTREQRQSLTAALLKSLEGREEQDSVLESLSAKNLKALFDRLGFGQEELQIAEFFLCMSDRNSIPPFNGLINKMQMLSEKDAISHIARFINMPIDKIQPILSAEAPLRKAAFISSSGGRDVVPYAVSGYICSILEEPHPDPDAMIDRLIGTVINTPHDFDRDFDFLGDKGKAIYEMVAGMLEFGVRPGKGTLCLYGGGGSGKTTLAAVIAKKLGYAIYDVGQCLPKNLSLNEGRSSYEREKEPSRHDQLNAFLLASFLVGKLGKKALLHVGEAEGIFRDPNDYRFQGGGLKNHIQAALDASSALTFMTTNNVDLIAESTLRRMIPVFHIPPMPWVKRAEVIIENARKTNLTVSFDMASELARAFPSLSPGMLEYTVQATGMRRDLKGADADTTAKALQLIFQETVRGVNGGKIATYAPVSIADFNPGLMNMGVDLNELAGKLKIKEDKGAGFSLCLIGPQGAGKRTCALWLCDQMGLASSRVSFANLLNKTSNGFNIESLTASIEGAALEGSALVIEGAEELFNDRFIFGRADADLFNCPLCPIVILADTAFDVPEDKLSRFTVAMRADYLSRSQHDQAFRSIIGLALPGGSSLPEKLTPGDFSKVRRQMMLISGPDAKPEMAVNLLKNIRQAAHPQSHFMGFSQR